MPGLGQFTLFRTTQAVAEEEGAAPALLPDLLINNLIPLNRAIPPSDDGQGSRLPHHLKGDDDPADRLRPGRPPDRRRTPKGDTFDLRVRAVREPRPMQDRGDGRATNSCKSSYFLDSDDDKVKALAEEIGRRRDRPVAKAQADREMGA